jgi:hypothetical protein
MLDLIKAKSDEKNCPARKSRKREDSDDLIKEIALRRTPKGSRRKKKVSHPLTRYTFPRKTLIIVFRHEHERSHSSGKRGCIVIMNRQG